MDEKVIFYIILGIVYFIFTRLKKKPAEQGDSQDQDVSPSRPERPPVSFEELLREITEAKQPKPAEPVSQRFDDPVASRKPAYVDYDDDIGEEEESLEKLEFDEDRITKIYEEAKQQASPGPSLEETARLEDVDTQYGRFKEFEKRQVRKPGSDLGRELRNRSTFKRAVILSEILNRKHF
jgi:hypothetical protein